MIPESNRNEQPYPHDDERLSAYLDGELSAPEQAQLEARLVVDAPLRQLVDELRAVRQQLEVLPEYKLGPDFAAKVLARAEQQFFLDQSPATPTAATTATSELSSVIPADSRSNTPEKPVPLTAATQPNWRRPVIWSLIASAAAILLLLTNRARDPETINVTQAKVTDNIKNTNEQAEKNANRSPETTQPDTQRLDQLRKDRHTEMETLQAKPAASAEPPSAMNVASGTAKPLAKALSQPQTTTGDLAITKERDLAESAKLSKPGNKFSATVEANDYALSKQDQRRNAALADDRAQLPVVQLANANDPQLQQRYRTLIAERTQFANAAFWDRTQHDEALSAEPATKQQQEYAQPADALQQFPAPQATGRIGNFGGGLGSARGADEPKSNGENKSKTVKKQNDLQPKESPLATESTLRYMVLDGDADQVDALLADLQTISQSADQLAETKHKNLSETAEPLRDQSTVRGSVPTINAYFFNDVELPSDLREQLAVTSGKSESRYSDQQSTLSSANSLELHLKAEQSTQAESSATVPPSLPLTGMATKPADGNSAADKAATPSALAGAAGPAPALGSPMNNAAASTTNGTTPLVTPANSPKATMAAPAAPVAPAISTDAKNEADSKPASEPSARMMQRLSNVPGRSDPESPADAAIQSSQAGGAQPPPAPATADPQFGVARKQSEKSDQHDAKAPSVPASVPATDLELAKSDPKPTPTRRKRVLLVFQAPTTAAPAAAAGLPATPEASQPAESAPVKPAKE
jgi:hypothetical protein